MKKYFIEFKEKDQNRQLYILAKTEKEAVKMFKDWNAYIEWRSGTLTFQIVREEKVDCRKDKSIMETYKKQNEYLEKAKSAYIQMTNVMKEVKEND